MPEFLYVWVLSDLSGTHTPTVFAKRHMAVQSFKLMPGVTWKRAREDGGYVTSDGWRLTRHPVCGYTPTSRQS